MLFVLRHCFLLLALPKILIALFIDFFVQFTRFRKNSVKGILQVGVRFRIVIGGCGVRELFVSDT